VQVQERFVNFVIFVINQRLLTTVYNFYIRQMYINYKLDLRTCFSSFKKDLDPVIWMYH